MEHQEDVRLAAQPSLCALGRGRGSKENNNNNNKKNCWSTRLQKSSRFGGSPSLFNRSLGESLVLQCSLLDPINRHTLLLLSLCPRAAAQDSLQENVKTRKVTFLYTEWHTFTKIRKIQRKSVQCAPCPCFAIRMWCGGLNTVLSHWVNRKILRIA